MISLFRSCVHDKDIIIVYIFVSPDQISELLIEQYIAFSKHYVSCIPSAMHYSILSIF